MASDGQRPYLHRKATPGRLSIRTQDSLSSAAKDPRQGPEVETRKRGWRTAPDRNDVMKPEDGRDEGAAGIRCRTLLAGAENEKKAQASADPGKPHGAGTHPAFPTLTGSAETARSPMRLLPGAEGGKRAGGRQDGQIAGENCRVSGRRKIKAGYAHRAIGGLERQR